MPRTILVPLDGSTLAERALPLGAALAAAAGADLVVLEVVPGEPEGAPGAGDEDARAAKAYLDGLVERVLVPPTAERRVVRGEPIDEILDAVRDVGAELIVMSTHGRSGVGRWLYGGVADGLMRRSPVPVLVLPPNVGAGWSPGRVPRVLVPLDGSEPAARAIGPAAALAHDLDAAIILLTVVKPDVLATSSPESWGMIAPSEVQAADETYLQQVAAPLRAEGRAVDAAVAFGLPIATISTVARERDVDFIAMSTHGRGRAGQAILGSVVSGVVRYADRPVLVVGPVVPVTPIAATIPSARVEPTVRTPEVGRTAEATAAGRGTVPSALATGSLELRKATVRELGRRGGANAVAALIDVLRDGPNLLRHDATYALIEIGPAAVPSLLPLLSFPDHAVRSHAAEALAHIADPASAPALVAALDDPDPAVRWYAARAVAHMGDRGVVVLLRALETRPLSPWLTQGAQRVLRHYATEGPKPASLQRLGAALTHSTASVEVPVRAAEALDEIAGRPRSSR